jgi:dTDP-4-dehydrorhamnose 3,5-epimerase
MKIPDVLLIEPTVHLDTRGLFLESFNKQLFTKRTGIAVDFVQDNFSRSKKGVLRGLHYQRDAHSQGKLVSVSRGAVWDVAVDLRSSSLTFKRWVGLELSGDNFRQLWIPPGFAHGFIVLSESADFAYKSTNYHSPSHECCIAWNDSSLGIQWPLIDTSLTISNNDTKGVCLDDALVFD